MYCFHSNSESGWSELSGVISTEPSRRSGTSAGENPGRASPVGRLGNSPSGMTATAAALLFAEERTAPVPAPSRRTIGIDGRPAMTVGSIDERCWGNAPFSSPPWRSSILAAWLPQARATAKQEARRAQRAFRRHWLDCPPWISTNENVKHTAARIAVVLWRVLFASYSIHHKILSPREVNVVQEDGRDPVMAPIRILNTRL